MLTIIYYIINPTALASDLDVDGRKVFFVWTVGSIAAGYLALYKTRVFLSYLSTQRLTSSLFFVVIIAIDFLITCLIYIAAWLATLYVGYLVQAPAGVPFNFLWFTQVIINDLFSRAIWFNDITGALFYAGLLPSLWLWLYVISVMLMRGIRRAQPVLFLLRRLLDIDNAPLRSVGVIAGGLTFVIAFCLLVISRVLIRS